ncbi:MAG: hypothetical protein IKR25_09440 [Muribaculaceae bacterium]|nr:hypothetical protein [Muribaculaceae bacterium]
MKKTLWVAVALLAMSLISCDGAGHGSKPVHDSLPAELTGDYNRDAEAIAQRSIELSDKMLNGTDTEDETQQLQQRIDAAKRYYEARDLRDDFMIVLNEKMTQGVTELASKVKQNNADKDNNVTNNNSAK